MIESLGKICPEFEQGSIRDGLAELHDKLSHISLQLDSLSSKLEPVLRPELSGACGSSSAVQLVDSRAPLARNIDELKSMADGVSNLAQSMLGRVDV